MVIVEKISQASIEKKFLKIGVDCNKPLKTVFGEKRNKTSS